MTALTRAIIVRIKDQENSRINRKIIELSKTKGKGEPNNTSTITNDKAWVISSQVNTKSLEKIKRHP